MDKLDNKKQTYRKNKKKFTILTDMDDTIEDLVSAWLSYLNKEHGTDVKKEDVRDWDLTLAFPNLTKQEVYEPLYSRALWESVKPSKDAAVVLKMLQSEGHEIYVVTSTNYKTICAKMENVLFKYFPFIDWDHVIITANKQMIRGDFLIDDAPHNLVNGNYNKILMDAPHNKNFDEYSIGAIRVKTWEEVYDIIMNMSEIYTIQEEITWKM